MEHYLIRATIIPEIIRMIADKYNLTEKQRNHVVPLFRALLDFWNQFLLVPDICGGSFGAGLYSWNNLDFPLL